MIHPFYDPKAAEKDAEVTIASSELNKIREERDRLLEALESIVSIVDTSSTRDIYNWGSDLRKIHHISNTALTKKCPTEYFKHKCESCAQAARESEK